MYIHELKAWPTYTWQESKFNHLLTDVHYQQGKLLGLMNALGYESQKEATLTTLTEDVIKTSAIEGEQLDLLQVRSSVAKHLGFKTDISLRPNKNVEGIVTVLFDAIKDFDQPLTQERLFSWHKSLFSSGESGFHKIKIGSWRNKSSGIMQVVSGPIGREKVHYVGPSYNRLKKEMGQFLRWFNTKSNLDLIIKSAIAHFWFVTIHPFDDGNGRIARALSDMLLARSERTNQRFYSMSSQIQKERNDYYHLLETCQKGTLDITDWLIWFLNCLQRAIHHSYFTLNKILLKAQFWQCHVETLFNERQRSIINRLLGDFQGKLTSSKWAKMTKCSQDTALRDINDLLVRKILAKEAAGGRSTSYKLILPLQIISDVDQDIL